MRTLFIVLILLISNLLSSQNITLSQFLRLQKKDAVNVEEYLSSKDWSLLSVENDSIFDGKAITFAYNKNYFNDSAESFINYYSLNDNASNSIRFISIQIHSQVKYNEYLNSIKATDFKLVKSNITDDSIVKIYKNSRNTVSIEIMSKKEDDKTKTTYLFSVFSNEFFERFESLKSD